MATSPVAPSRTAAVPLAQMSGVSKSFARGPVLNEVSLAFAPGSKVGVIGANGSGKSVLLRLLAGLEPPSSGQVRVAHEARVGLLDQEPSLDPEGTVQSTVEEAAADVRQIRARFTELCDRLETAAADPAPLLSELGELGEILDRRDGWNLESQLAQAQQALDCPDADTPVSVLSGGERRRVALCRLLISRPDLLLLDEPTNHLDAETVRWLGEHLASYPGTLVVTSHDRGFLDAVTDSIVELERCRAKLFPGGYSDYLRRKACAPERHGRKDVWRRRRLLDELRWVDQEPHTRRQAARHRMRDYEQRALTAEQEETDGPEELMLPPGPRLGTHVVEAEHLVKTVAGRKLIDDLSFSLPRGGIVALLGPNGTGKTTLLRMIAGLEGWDAGTLRVGESVRIAYADQTREHLDDPARRLRDLVADGQEHVRIGPRQVPVGAFLARFGLRGEEQRLPAGRASGGQRGRLNLAMTLAQGGNLLLLDEPTNDLDLATVNALEHALLRFPGCAVIASHDSWLLDRLATHVLAWESHLAHEGRWTWFEGPLSSYRHLRGEQARSAGPHHRLAHT